MKFSEKLQTLRKENKLSQEQLADMLDVSRQAVSKWESGMTYPEIDKLITMCKIFKCSLDDLTNDEVSEIKVDDSKTKSKLDNFIDEGLDFIKRCCLFFKSMTFKDFIKFAFEMLIAIILLIILHLPFNAIYQAGSQIFANFGLKVGDIMSSFLNFIIMLAYLAVSLFLFVYVFKIRYLDDINLIQNVKKDYNTDNVKLMKNVNSSEVKKNDNNVVIIERKKEGKTFFDVLAKIVLLFVKGMLFFISIPFLISLVLAAACLIVTIILLFKGVFYLGILLGIIAFIALNVVTLQLMYYFILDIKANLKRSVLVFLIALGVGGIAIGITMIDVSNTKYYDTMPKNADVLMISNEFKMKDDLYFDETYFVDYHGDDSLGDKVVIKVSYYKNAYNNVMIKQDGRKLYISYENTDMVSLKDGFDLIVDGLANKELYNYDRLRYLNVDVYASNANLTKMRDNNFKVYNYYDDYYNYQ